MDTTTTEYRSVFKTKNLCCIKDLDHSIDFAIGQIVYLKTDNEQNGRMVTGITLRPNKGVFYHLALGTNETVHFAVEIDSEKDVLKATSN
jgi:hypothetical protein